MMNYQATKKRKGKHQMEATEVRNVCIGIFN